MNNINTLLLGCSFSLVAMQAVAQDDMLDILQKETAISTEKTIATFKAIKIINLQSNETVKKGNLDFWVSHLFGYIGTESGGGVHTLYGLDQSADIRISFNYGISDRLNVGVSRMKRHENLEGEIKYKILEQTVDHKMPVSITVFGNAAYTPKEDARLTKTAHRVSYVTQAIISHKFSSRFSLEVVPSFLHRNLVGANDENDLFSIGGGGRWKFSRSTSIIADYIVNFSRPEQSPKSYDPLGVGFEVETGGHVFTLMFTNASGILENDFLANTVDNWGDGGFKFSFHISRMFTLTKK